jgi:glycosyltransferase involved in cell wall biosynthesis
MTTLCLCMIVKNESKIITKCLNSIVDYLDYWVICDTGSTDGTQDIIKSYFKEKNIKGELHEDEWVNFGHNRTLALKRAKNKTKYCFIIDADDRLVGKLFIPNDKIYKMFNMKIILGNLEYSRVQILCNSLDWEYKGVVHEYPDLITKNNYDGGTIQNSYIQAGTFGDRSINNGSKFTRDIKLLLQGIIDEPNNSRYYFYLAQSYKDINDNKNAIKYYKKRVEMGGWMEEVYYSLYMIGICKQREGLNFENEILYDYLKAFNYRKNRLEALYEIVKYYRMNKKYREGYSYGMLGIINTFPKDVLFIDRDIHTYKFIDEMAICAYWIKDYKLSIKLNNKLLKLDCLDNINRNRIKNNLIFSLDNF